MTAATTSPPARARVTPARRALDVLLALIAHVAVGASWVVVAAAVMGTLDVLRRMAMNSEWAWDTGRLPQPWVIPLGLLAAAVSHVFFTWSMRRVGGGRLPWDGRVIALCGVLLGVLLGSYLGTPALEVGTKVGPASGQATPWGPLGWMAHYARLALPALVGLVTAAALLLSRHSPLVVLGGAAVRWARGGRGRRFAGARRTRTTHS